MTDSLVDKKTVCVITGPTRGLGKSIALLLAQKLPKGSLFILLSRNESLLVSVASKVKENNDINAVWAIFDQGSADGDSNENILRDSLSNAGVSPKEFEQAMLINNAGTLEPCEYVRDLGKLDELTHYFKVNLAGCMTLTASFLKVFGAVDVKIRTVVNISSLAGISPIKSWSPYCMGQY